MQSAWSDAVAGVIHKEVEQGFPGLETPHMFFNAAVLTRDQNPASKSQILTSSLDRVTLP